MTKLPKEARSIAMIIRRGVKRPSPSMFEFDSEYRWRTKKGECCPMGMHPKSASRCPAYEYPYGFRPSKNLKAVTSFWMWWDQKVGKNDLKEAIDAVWGKK